MVPMGSGFLAFTNWLFCARGFGRFFRFRRCFFLRGLGGFSGFGAGIVSDVLGVVTSFRWRFDRSFRCGHLGWRFGRGGLCLVLGASGGNTSVFSSFPMNVV